MFGIEVLKVFWYVRFFLVFNINIKNILMSVGLYSGWLIFNLFFFWLSFKVVFFYIILFILIIF